MSTHRPLSTRPPEDDRRPGELGFRELLRWVWRQVTSMRTALILLLLLALAAIPGSIIPQEGVDALKTSNWQADHPKLTPVYERLGLFSVYDSPWFSAIYLLLMLSLVGCIVPRTCHYWRGIRAKPPAAPRNLTRLPDHATYHTTEDPGRRPRAGPAGAARARYRLSVADDAVSAERGYLREVGNLLFHLSVLVVLVGFAMGSLFGYKGGVILVVGSGFSNTLTQYDDFDPGSLFQAEDMEPFYLQVDDFDVDWLTDGPRGRHGARLRGAHDVPGVPRRAREEVRPQGQPPADDRRHRRVPHRARLRAGDHGQGRQRRRRLQRADDLPADSTRPSSPSGVVKAPHAEPTQIGLEGEFYPTVAFSDAHRQLLLGVRQPGRPDDLDARLHAATSTWTTACRSRSTRSTRPTPRC